MKKKEKSNYKIMAFKVKKSNFSSLLEFEGEKNIGQTYAFDYVCLPKYKNGKENFRSLKAEWTTEEGGLAGLTNEMLKTGIGIIEIDGEHEKTYTKYICALNGEEIAAVMNESETYKEIFLDFFTESDLEFMGVDHFFKKEEEE